MASLSSLTHNLFSCLAAEVEAFAGLRGCLCPARRRWDSSEPVPANADYQSSASKTMMSLVANVQFQRQLALAMGYLSCFAFTFAACNFSIVLSTRQKLSPVG